LTSHGAKESPTTDRSTEKGKTRLTRRKRRRHRPASVGAVRAGHTESPEEGKKKERKEKQPSKIEVHKSPSPKKGGEQVQVESEFGPLGKGKKKKW